MTQIIIGTTPTITYKFKIVSPTELEKAILTIKHFLEWKYSNKFLVNVGG